MKTLPKAYSWLPDHIRNAVMARSQNVLDAIISDLTDRRFLESEWDQIDDDVKQEIKDTWLEIIYQSMVEERATSSPY